MSISYKISWGIQIWTLILFPKLELNEIFAEVISYDTKLFYKPKLEPNKIVVLFYSHKTEMGIHSRARPTIASLLVFYWI